MHKHRNAAIRLGVRSTPCHPPYNMPSNSTSARGPTVKTRVLIISDTHNADLGDGGVEHAFRSPLPKADVVLHCGDLTKMGEFGEYERTINMLKKLDAELKLVIAGNHDISLDPKYYARMGRDMHGGIYNDLVPERAMRGWKDESLEEHGIKYLDEGTYTFSLKNGAKFTVYASPYQPEFCDWAFPYKRTEDRWNPPELVAPGIESIAQNIIPSFPNVDIVMTHGPPMDILDTTLHGDHVGCEHLTPAMQRARPLIHAFGHIHEGWGAQTVRWDGTGRGPATKEDIATFEECNASECAFVDVSDVGRALKWGEETLMVNASIMDVHYRVTQRPWVVDVDLPRI